jgi:crossover junction endodeoxyribonuclease RuvC
MRTIAIDPGYERLGIAVIEKKDSKSKEELVFSECFFTDAKLPHPTRLANIGIELDTIIDKYKPDALAVETLFFSKNTKTALKVAEARGVILHAAARKNLLIQEYSPVEIKVAVTGYGKSDKAQVTAMVMRLIAISKIIKYDDEYDAIAIGLTFFAQYRVGYPQK